MDKNDRASKKGSLGEVEERFPISCQSKGPFEDSTTTQLFKSCKKIVLSLNNANDNSDKLEMDGTGRVLMTQDRNLVLFRAYLSLANKTRYPPIDMSLS